MGSLKQLTGRRVYLDANILIYALEGILTYQPVIQELFTRSAEGELDLFTSELSLAEMLVKPIRNGDVAAQQRCRELVTPRSGFDVRPVGREALVRAAEFRARTRLKLPDAIHAATAQLARCDVFLTNDRRLENLENIQIVILSEISFDV